MNTMDISGLASKLRNDVKSSIQNEVFKVCEKALRDSIMQTLYSGQSPTYYSRTYDIANSVAVKDVVINNSSAEFRITVDASKMSMINPEPNAPYGRWGTHVGFSGQDFREGLIEILDEGGGNRYYMHSANHFFDKAATGLDTDIVNTLVRALSSKGWDVEIG